MRAWDGGRKGREDGERGVRTLGCLLPYSFTGFLRGLLHFGFCPHFFGVSLLFFVFSVGLSLL